MAKVFIMEAVTSLTVDSETFLREAQNYWGTDTPRLFIIHYSEILHLQKNGGYMGVRVIDIEDEKEVRVKWLPFRKNQEKEYIAKDTNDYFFFLKDSALELILKKPGVTDDNKKILIFSLLKSDTGDYHALFYLGVLSEIGGIGGGTPSAGARVP